MMPYNLIKISMDMDQLKKNLEEALEELDAVIEEGNKMKIKLRDA